ncbi:unnamed protein product [Amoebophrya sp. A25]|nr:unnamed protein product [Amoebophrya sp. A25]|eukprot:GSA25T00022864001.1
MSGTSSSSSSSFSSAGVVHVISLPVLWKCVARITAAAVAHSKQPMTVLWILSLIQLCDGITLRRREAIHGSLGGGSAGVNGGVGVGSSSAGGGGGVNKDAAGRTSSSSQLQARSSSMLNIKGSPCATAVLHVDAGDVASKTAGATSAGSSATTTTNLNDNADGSSTSNPAFFDLGAHIDISRFKKDVGALVTRVVGLFADHSSSSETASAQQRNKSMDLSPPFPPHLEATNEYDTRAVAMYNWRFKPLLQLSKLSSGIGGAHQSSSPPREQFLQFLPPRGSDVASLYALRFLSVFLESLGRGSDGEPKRGTPFAQAVVDALLYSKYSTLVHAQVLGELIPRVVQSPSSSSSSSSSKTSSEKTRRALPLEDRKKSSSSSRRIKPAEVAPKDSSTMSRQENDLDQVQAQVVVDDACGSSTSTSTTTSERLFEIQEQREAAFRALHREREALYQSEWAYLLLCSLQHLPYDLYRTTIMKTLRSSLLAAINDGKFFEQNLVDARSLGCWQTIVRELITAERATNAANPSFNSDSQSSLFQICWVYTRNILTTPLQESTRKVEFLRRLSFVLFSGEQDVFANELREIITKLTQCLQTKPLGGQLRIEVLFVIRILLLKMAPRYLTPCWPLILAELIGVFSSLSAKVAETVRQMHMTKGTSINSASNRRPLEDELETKQVLAALKLVDMAGLLDLEEFTLHQWMFHTTVDVTSGSASNLAGSTSAGAGTSGANTQRVAGNNISTTREVPSKPEKKFRPFSVTLRRLLERVETLEQGSSANSSSSARTTTTTASSSIVGCSSATLTSRSNRNNKSSTSTSTITTGSTNTNTSNIIEHDTPLLPACRMLNDTSIGGMLSRQQISHEERMRLVAQDFLSVEAAAHEFPVFDAAQYAKRIHYAVVRG